MIILAVTITLLILFVGSIWWLVFLKIKKRGIGKHSVTDALISGIVAGPIGIILTLLTVYIQISYNESKEIEQSVAILYTEMTRILAESKTFDSTAKALIVKYQIEDVNSEFKFNLNEKLLSPVLMTTPFVQLSEDRWQEHLDKIIKKITPEEYARIQNFFLRYQWYDKNNPVTSTTMIDENDRPEEEADKYALRRWWSIYTSQYIVYKNNGPQLCGDIMIINKLLQLSKLERKPHVIEGYKCP